MATTRPRGRPTGKHPPLQPPVPLYAQEVMGAVAHGLMPSKEQGFGFFCYPLQMVKKFWRIFWASNLLGQRFFYKIWWAQMAKSFF